MQGHEFEYDVFLSFASADEELVRGLWQQLTQAGLRVFWSDSVLRERVGVSWFDVIQESIGRSRHLLWVCSSASLESRWVKREYIAFFNNHYAPPNRRLVPLLTSGTRFSDLPLFLRELQAVALTDSRALSDLIRTLGGVDIDRLKADLVACETEVFILRRECASLKLQLARQALRKEATPDVVHKAPEPEASIGAARTNSPSQTSDSATSLRGVSPRRPDEFEKFINHIAQSIGVPPAAVAITLLVLVGLLGFALQECGK